MTSEPDQPHSDAADRAQTDVEREDTPTLFERAADALGDVAEHIGDLGEAIADKAVAAASSNASSLPMQRALSSKRVLTHTPAHDWNHWSVTLVRVSTSAASLTPSRRPPMLLVTRSGRSQESVLWRCSRRN